MKIPHFGFRTRLDEEKCCLLPAHENVDSDSLSDTGTASPGKTSASHRGVCSISAYDAIHIFVAAKHDRAKRDGLAIRLANDFGITAKAVRDIWNLRTWAQVTKPFWSPLEECHSVKRKHSKDTKRMSRVKSRAKPSLRQDNDVPTTSITRLFADAMRNAQPFDPSKSWCGVDGEWMVEPCFIAQEFESILLECSDMKFILDCDDDVNDNAAARAVHACQ